MINSKLFFDRLESRIIIGLMSINKTNKKISSISRVVTKFESKEKLNHKEAIQFLRESIKVEANIMLRDVGLSSISIIKKSNPFLFEIMSGGDIDFEYVFGELNGR